MQGKNGNGNGRGGGKHHDGGHDPAGGSRAGGEHAGHDRAEHDHTGHDHSSHHRMMIRDFRKRFFVSLGLTVPILILSPTVQGILGYSLSFPFSRYLLFALASGIFFYGGWPFLTGLVDELRRAGVRRIWVGGLAQDICVRATVLDGLEAGFETHLIRAATRPVDRQDGSRTLEEMQRAGAVVES